MNVSTAVQTIRYQVYESTSGFFGDDEIRQYLWDGECDLARHIECVEAVTNITATTGTQEYSFTSIETIKRVTYDGERLKKVDFRDLDKVDNDGTSTNAQTGDPTHYYLWGNGTVGLWPIPTTSAAVKIWGNGTPTQITSSATQFTVPTQFHNYLPDYALYRMYLKDQDDGRANAHLSIWEKSKAKSQAEWNRRKGADRIYVVKDEYTYPTTTLGMK